MIAGLSGIALLATMVVVPPQPSTRFSDDTVLRRTLPTVVMPDTALAAMQSDSVKTLRRDTLVALALPAGLLAEVPDTTPRRRAVVYSDAYGTRATIHRRLSYSMLPLFAISYFTGDQLFKNGPSASSLIRNGHRASATAVSVLFAVNAVTGGINLWEGRHDPIQRKRKILHSALFVAASAGFSYAGSVLANQAETSLIKRQDHRNLNLISMGLSAGSVLVMMVGND